MPKKLIGFFEPKTMDIDEIAKDIAKEIGIEDQSYNEIISIWIFQCNPDRYDLIGALKEKEKGNSVDWRVNQHRSEIKKGHLALIWKAGKDAGIYAIGRIECDPQLIKEEGFEKKFWLEKEEKENIPMVRISILKSYITKPILKEELLQHPALKNLSIFKFHQGTNYPVKDSEWGEISKLILC